MLEMLQEDQLDGNRARRKISRQVIGLQVKYYKCI